VSDVCGRCWEVALGDGRRSPYHLGRRRDTGPPGETIDIPINTGEQSSLALPTGEGHEPSMDRQLPHAFSEPMSSHCETGLVSRGLRGLLASWSSRFSRSRAGGPAAAEACAPLGRCLAYSPARHGFCSLSLAEAEQPRQDALGCGWGEATGVFLSARDTHGHTPPSHHSRPHRGPLPLAVGAGILPREPEDVQVEAPEEWSAPPPWACGRGAWQIGVPVGGAHACLAGVS
jgi:hypothetical protein